MRTTTDVSEKMKKNVKKRFSYVKLFWLFMIGSVIGFVLEGIWYMLITQSAWENHSATIELHQIVRTAQKGALW